MGKLSQRMRAALGMGVTWGLAWLGAGLILLVVLGPGAADVPFPLGFGFLGFLAGAIFSLTLSLAAGGLRFKELSMPRFAGWGAAAGLVFSVPFVAVTFVVGSADLIDDLVYLAPLFAAAGAASAAGSLAVARMGEGPELVESGNRGGRLED